MYWLLVLLSLLLGFFFGLFLRVLFGVLLSGFLRLTPSRFLGLLIGFLCFGFFPLDRVVYFSAVNRNALRCGYTQPHLIPTYVDDSYFNVIADHD
jgi:hypothetical protein